MQLTCPSPEPAAGSVPAASTRPLWASGPVVCEIDRGASNTVHVYVCVCPRLYTVRYGTHARRTRVMHGRLHAESTAALYWSGSRHRPLTHGQTHRVENMHSQTGHPSAGARSGVFHPQNSHMQGQAHVASTKPSSHPDHPSHPNARPTGNRLNHTYAPSRDAPSPQTHRVHEGTSAIESSWGNARGSCEAEEGSQGHHNSTRSNTPL